MGAATHPVNLRIAFGTKVPVTFSCSWRLEVQQYLTGSDLLCRASLESCLLLDTSEVNMTHLLRSGDNCASLVENTFNQSEWR